MREKISEFVAGKWCMSEVLNRPPIISYQCKKKKKNGSALKHVAYFSTRKVKNSE